MTAPASGRDDATLRGAVVLVVAIVIGLALLARSGGGGDDDATSDRDSTTTEASASDSASTEAGGDTSSLPVDPNTSSTTTAPVTTVDPASITVAVLNATETVGLAGDKADILASAGYQTATGNVVDNQDTTTIYATPEAQADATAIKTLLGLGGASVVEKGEETLGRNGEDAGADVVVVLGADSTGDTTGSTDTTAADG